MRRFIAKHPLRFVLTATLISLGLISSLLFVSSIAESIAMALDFTRTETATLKESIRGASRFGTSDNVSILESVDVIVIPSRASPTSAPPDVDVAPFY